MKKALGSTSSNKNKREKEEEEKDSDNAESEDSPKRGYQSAVAFRFLGLAVSGSVFVFSFVESILISLLHGDFVEGREDPDDWLLSVIY